MNMNLNHTNISMNLNQNHSRPNNNYQTEKENITLVSLFENNGNSGIHSRGQISFKNLVFDDTGLEENYFVKGDRDTNRESREDNFSEDKENSPPLPRESSKFSYIDNNESSSNSAINHVDINLEAGISHITSDSNKVVEIPISIDLKLKDHLNQPNIFSKDYIIIFNTRSLNSEGVYHIFKQAFDKLHPYDRIFTNVFKLEKWISKDELKDLISYGLNNFETNLQDTSILDYTEVIKLISFCIDLSFEYHSNVFAVILLNDVDEIPLDVDSLEELKVIVNKFKESKANLIKNFTINSILLDGKSEENKTYQNIKSVSFLYDLSMLCMGYFFAPKVII
jgi:hypothetical protein